MKRFFQIALFVLLLTPVARSQHAPTNSEAADLADRFVANCDSLLSSFHIGKYTDLSHRHRSNINTDYSFDQIPDSVLSRRMQSLKTVVPMSYNPEVRSYIRMYFNRMTTRLDLMLSLSDFYFPVFEQVLSKYGLPEELKYLSIVESALNPQATSRVGAAGLWQFMYTTGKNYGLEVNSVVDERRDTYKSTDAAARYLRDLYRVFGDWHLAIAAYNCGPGCVNKAIARSGGKHGFWQIYPYLPRETRGYIPAYIAATYIMNFYPEHGLRPRKVDLPLNVDTVMVERDMMFHFVGKYAGIDSAQVRSLNPQYRADYIPGRNGSYPLCLPFAAMGDVIKWADSIFLASADSLSRRVLVAPAAGGKAKGAAKGSGATYHKVRRGETLTSIAARYGTKVSRLKKLNGLKSDRIREGQRLRVR